MLRNLRLLEQYPHYFQITITGYGKAVEPRLSPKEEIIASFKALSDRIGKERTIWRYDPIIITKEYGEEFHARVFAKLARNLAGYTNRCVISFLDLYKKTTRNIRSLGETLMTEESMLRLAEILSPIARDYGFALETCSEEIDLLTPFGVRQGKCIDPLLISQISGRKLSVKKDPHQRLACGCASSVDIGAYNSCLHGCIYCYANFNQRVVERQVLLHNPHSPLLIGELGARDKVTDRKVKGQTPAQLDLFR
jgi:DNA repair photolyase